MLFDLPKLIVLNGDVICFGRKDERPISYRSQLEELSSAPSAKPVELGPELAEPQSVEQK